MVPVVLSQVNGLATYYYSSSYAEFWNLAYELNTDINDFSRDVKKDVKVKRQSAFCWGWERVSWVFKCRNILKDRQNHFFKSVISKAN